MSSTADAAAAAAAAAAYEQAAEAAASARRALLRWQRPDTRAVDRLRSLAGSARACAGGEVLTLAAAVDALASAGAGEAHRAGSLRAVHEAERARAGVLPLLLLATELLAPAGLPAGAGASASPLAATAVARLLRESPAACKGHEFFALRALSGADAASADVDDLRKKLETVQFFKQGAAATVRENRWQTKSADELADMRSFASAQGVVQSPGAPPALALKSVDSPLRGRSPGEVAGALFSPPSLDDATLCALDGVFDSAFAVVGVWNLGGNAILKSGAAVVAAVTGALPAAEDDGELATTSRAAAKVLNLEALILRERWSAVALQEVSKTTSLTALMQEHVALAGHWRWVVSDSLGGRGFATPNEAAAFGYDRRAWLLETGPAVLQLQVPPHEQQLARAPALLVLRSRLHASRRLALVSVHLTPGAADARREVAALGAALLAAVDAALIAAQRPPVDADQDAVALVGDFNLAPPGHDSDSASAPLDACWHALVDSCGFVNAKTSATATNVHEFIVGTPAKFATGTPRQLDGALVRAPWARSAAAHVVDIVRGGGSSLADEVAAAARAVEALPADAQSPEVRSFVLGVQRLFMEAVTVACADGQRILPLGEGVRRRFVAEYSDHKPLTLTLGAPKDASGGSDGSSSSGKGSGAGGEAARKLEM